jgi:hypothetical protein
MSLLTGGGERVTASYVTVVLDLRDGQGRQLSGGQAVLRPSWALNDVPDMQVIPPAAAVGTFAPRTTPAVQLLASDSPGPQPAAWTWDIEFSVPGRLGPRSVFAPAGPVAFTAAGGSPAVFTWTPGGEAYQVQQLPAGTGVRLSGGSLPGGFQAGAVYFVAASSGWTVQLAAYQGGPALAALSAGSGELSVVQWQLSALTSVQPAVDLGAALPLPGGTPAAGLVPVATGNGEATAWGEPFVQLAGDAMEGPLSPAVTTLTFASTVPVDAALGNVYSLAMTGACTLGSPAGGTDGQVVRLRVTSNGNALTYGASYQFGSGGQPPLSSSGLDVLAFEFVAALSAWVFLGGGGQGYSG